MQLVALSMLAFAPPSALVVAYVMVSQALSGIAKDMTKMSSKSAVKLIVPEEASATLYRWVAILTGSKNALKGVGFFLGGLLLTLLDFQSALQWLVALVGTTLLLTALLMRGGLGQANKKAKFGQMFSRNGAVNKLAAARIFLFGARDVWFVVGLRVCCASGCRNNVNPTVGRQRFSPSSLPQCRRRSRSPSMRASHRLMSSSSV
jgi:hypothetical protein